MKKLAEQANNLVREMQMVSDSISDYNPGLSKEKTPLHVIQYDLASLEREITALYSKIGDKVRNEKV